MELLQLKYFCAAAQNENFSKTARSFFVPTSNISQSIKRLEGELGCELFEHSSNKITLNQNGKQFYSYVCEALALLENARAELTDQLSKPHGEIRLICLCSRKSVTRAIEELIQRYPAVTFSIHHTAKPEANYDILISDVSPFPYGKRILLQEEPICVAIRRDNPLANKSTLSLVDLQNERFISMTQGSSLYRTTVSACSDAGFSPNIVIQTDDPAYVRKYTQMGLGIAFVPALSWGGLFSEDVVLREIAGLKRKTYAFFPKGRRTPSSVEEFLKILKEKMSPR